MRPEDEVKIVKLVLSLVLSKNEKVSRYPARIWAMLDALGDSVSRATHSTQAFADLERSAIFSSVNKKDLSCIVKASTSLLHYRARKHVCSGATEHNNGSFMQALNYAAKDRQGKPRSVLV